MKFKSLIVALALQLVVFSHAEDLKIGIQTWTLRNLNFDQMVEFSKKHNLKYVQLIPNHLDVKSSREEWQRKKEIMEKAGLIPYTYGVAGTSLKKEENRPLFEMAKFMGMKMVIVEPGD